MNTRSLVLTVLIAGVVIGVLANLPVLNLINCALCIWVWLGGGLAVFIYRRFQQGQPGPTPAQGAGLGALSGLVGALVGAVVFMVTSPISSPSSTAWRAPSRSRATFPSDRVRFGIL